MHLGPQSGQAADLSLLERWVDPGLQLLTIIVGTGIVLYQLHRQHRNDLGLQADNQRNHFRLGLHERLAGAIDQASRKLTPLGLWGGNVVSELRSRRVLSERGLGSGATRNRASGLSQHHSEANKAVVAVMGLLERNEVGLPGFENFRLALSVQLERIGEAFRALHSAVLPYLSSDLSAKQAESAGVDHLPPMKAGSEKEVEQLDDLASTLSSETLDLQAWLLDLAVEQQNELLQPLFGRLATHRKPRDPGQRVITRSPDAQDELRAFLIARSPYAARYEELRLQDPNAAASSDVEG